MVVLCHGHLFIIYHDSQIVVALISHRRDVDCADVFDVSEDENLTFSWGTYRVRAIDSSRDRLGF